MQVSELFLYSELTPADQIAFARAFQLCLRIYGESKCWRMDRNSHPVFSGFNTSHPNSLMYRGVEARPLILGMSGRYQEEGEVAIRRSICKSTYCLNPAHYYWGTRSQVMLEKQKNRQKAALSMDLIDKLRLGRREGRRVLDLSRQYKVPYHTVRRICSCETYENLNTKKTEMPTDLMWTTTVEICKQLTARYPEESKEHNLAIHVTDHLECPWHRNGFPGHKGNFGLMGECLDCMEEIKKGRCAVDVTNFDMNWYWTVKRFWEQVDIKSEDECWAWLGSCRKDGTESTAYFPSPFHSGKAHSASRVAFWLSRGYTGKYRVFSRPECDKFCCNPKHLHIREIKNMPEPAIMGEVKLNHGNIFQSYRENHAKEQPGSAK
jgi:hypothetical protein